MHSLCVSLYHRSVKETHVLCKYCACVFSMLPRFVVLEREIEWRGINDNIPGSAEAIRVCKFNV